MVKMEKTNSRVTMIMGAGAVLDMSFPCGIIKPTTSNITNEVRKPYKDIFNDKREITIVDDIYQHLMKTFPADFLLFSVLFFSYSSSL